MSYFIVSLLVFLFLFSDQQYLVLPYVSGLPSIWFLVRQAVLGCVTNHRVILKSNQPFVGYFHNLCATIALAYLTGRTDCSPKVLWLSWRLPFCFSSLQGIFLNQWQQNVELKVLFRYHLHSALFCSGLQQQGLAVCWQRVTYCLGNSLGCLGIFMGPLQPNH